MQVAVRTEDPQLARSLQSDLGDLVSRLENKGFKTESWIPAAVQHAAAPAAAASASAGQGQSEHSGSGAGQQQQRQGQNQSNQRQQPRWMAQLEETMANEDESRENQ